MATVTMLKPSLSAPLTVEVRSQEHRTLLSLLKQFQLFDEASCHAGRCGECAVKVALLTAQGDQPLPARLSENEKSILFKAGRLSREQYEAELVPTSPPLWRLACEYMLRYDEIYVAV